MARLFEYRDADIFCHHSLDEVPSTADFYMHAHERMEILYFLSGDAQYLVEGSVYPVNPGELLIMNSAETHKLHLLSDKPYERIVIHFTPTVLRGIDPDGLLLRAFTGKPLGRNNRYVSEKFRAIFSDFDAVGSDAQLRIHVLLVLANALEELAALSGSAASDGTDCDSAAHRILQYVNDHLFEDISLSSISRVFFLSQSQLNRVFRQTAGAPVGEYIRIKRLLAARERILIGESPAAACAACGFGDYSSFFRAYKAKFGHAPSCDGKTR